MRYDSPYMQCEQRRWQSVQNCRKIIDRQRGVRA